MANTHAENLVNLWLRNSIGGKEDFDIMVIGFLETVKENISVREVLNQAKERAHEAASNYPEDIALQLSHKAFDTSLEYLCQHYQQKAMEIL
jgi:hypothetical protein